MSDHFANRNTKDENRRRILMHVYSKLLRYKTAAHVDYPHLFLDLRFASWISRSYLNDNKLYLLAFVGHLPSTKAEMFQNVFVL